MALLKVDRANRLISALTTVAYQLKFFNFDDTIKKYVIFHLFRRVFFYDIC